MTDTDVQQSTGAPTDVGTAFKRLKPLLFGALSKLARQGFIVSPPDGVDLIHDFLTEEIPGLKQRFDPAKGDFSGYAYQAFIRFARPRIMRLQRFQHSLVSIEDLERLSGGDTKAELELAPDYQQPLEQAIEELPPLEGSVLKTYIGANVPSERLVAKGLGLSRYQVRETLVSALGHVIVQLSRPPDLPERDWKVARALWHDQRTPGEAASYLGMTTHQVRQAQARVTKFLETVLRNVQPTRHYTRRNKMTPEARLPRLIIPAQQLLAQVLKARGDSQLLQQLRDRSEEVLEALEKNDCELVPEDESLSLDPEWLAEVYKALSGDARLTPEEQSFADALFFASEAEECSVGEAFSQVLWPALPDELHNLEIFFSNVPCVSQQRVEELRQQPSVKGGRPYAELLTDYGFTPMTIFHATEAVSSSIERLQDYGMIDDRAPVGLFPTRIEAQGERRDILKVESLITEIRTSTDCGEVSARSLYTWLLRVAQYKPFLFDSFQAQLSGDGVVIQRTDDQFENLFVRWRSPAAVLYA